MGGGGLTETMAKTVDQAHLESRENERRGEQQAHEQRAASLTRADTTTQHAPVRGLCRETQPPQPTTAQPNPRQALTEAILYSFLQKRK